MRGAEPSLGAGRRRAGRAGGGAEGSVPQPRWFLRAITALRPAPGTGMEKRGAAPGGRAAVGWGPPPPSLPALALLLPSRKAMLRFARRVGFVWRDGVLRGYLRSQGRGGQIKRTERPHIGPRGAGGSGAPHCMRAQRSGRAFPFRRASARSTTSNSAFLNLSMKEKKTNRSKTKGCECCERRSHPADPTVPFPPSHPPTAEEGQELPPPHKVQRKDRSPTSRFSLYFFS